MNMNIDSEGKGTTSWNKLDQAQISMPSAEQIVKATGQTFNNNISFKYNLPLWLYENLVNSYWTSTPDATSAYTAWEVYYMGYANGGSSIRNTSYVRPVITIKKSQLSN